MYKNNTGWTFEEVKTILDTDSKDITQLLSRVKRGKASISLLRWQANAFQKGKTSVASEPLRKHFVKYFTNKGNMKLEEQPQEKIVEKSPKTVKVGEKEDICKHELEGLVKKVEETFNLLQIQMAEIAKINAQHQLHATKEKLDSLQAWKEQTEPELIQLRTFRDTAKKSNIGSMLRQQSPF